MAYCIYGTCWQGFGKLREARDATGTWVCNVLGLCSRTLLKGRAVHPGFPSLHCQYGLLPLPSCTGIRAPPVDAGLFTGTLGTRCGMTRGLLPHRGVTVLWDSTEVKDKTAGWCGAKSYGKRGWGGFSPMAAADSLDGASNSQQGSGAKIPLGGGSRGARGEDPSLTIALHRVKAKKGVNLLSTKSRNGQWLVSSELLTGGKHSTATVDVSRVDGARPR